MTDSSDGRTDDDHRIEKSFRGISRRLAVHYLRNLGGVPIVDGQPTTDAADVDNEAVDTVCGEGWRASLSSRRVNPGGSLYLTEVTVVFTGRERAVEAIVERFSKKAMRAGG